MKMDMDVRRLSYYFLTVANLALDRSERGLCTVEE